MFTFLRIDSIVVSLIALASLIPVCTAVVCGEYAVLSSFLIPLAVVLVIGIIFYYAGKNNTISLSALSVFAIVAGIWITLSIYSAIPLYLSGSVTSFTDAVFESVSGFTTTGATILSDIEHLPRSINVWRCEMHWLGGMGIIALTVALMPLLGVGGFQLIKAESTGPDKSKITPKIATTAELLWIIYFLLTVIETILLMCFGMDFIDALSHAFATLGTGGFSTRNASVGAFNSTPIDIVCTVFMFLAGVNFSLYFYVITGKKKELAVNSEFKAYVVIFVTAIILITISLIPYYGSFGTALNYASFQTASIMSTTGFATADYTLWPPFAQAVLFILFFIGGCSGSTAGGFKVVRWVVLGKQAHNEMLRMLHPHGVFSIRLDGKAGRKDLVFSVASFVCVYSCLVVITTLVGSLGGLDVFTSFTAALSMLGNIGPAFGKLGPSANYGFLCGAVKWWYCFAMIAGRLELYNLIIFFISDNWKN